MALSRTLQIDSAHKWPSDLAYLGASMVSSVSPDWEMVTTSCFGLATASRVAVFAGDFNLAWNTGDGLEPVTADRAGVITDCHRRDQHAVDLRQDVWLWRRTAKTRTLIQNLFDGITMLSAVRGLFCILQV